MCVCDNGYNGKSCLFSDSEISRRREVREEMIATFKNLLTAEDPSVDTVESWIFFLSALVQNPDELSSGAVATIGNMTSTVLAAANTVGMGYEKLLSLFDIADIVVELRDLVTVSDDTDTGAGRRRLLSSRGGLRTRVPTTPSAVASIPWATLSAGTWW